VESGGNILDLLRQMQASLHDQVSAVKEDAEASLQLAAEAEAKANAIVTDNAAAKETLELVRQLADRVKALESDRWIPMFLSILVKDFTTLLSVSAWAANDALRMGNSDVYQRIIAAFSETLTEWEQLWGDALKIRESSAASNLLSRSNEVVTQFFKRSRR